jgi:copper chaperone
MMDNTTFNVDGMSCQGCVASVTRVLKAIPGVADVTVTLKPGTATVVYDGAQTSVPALKAAVEGAGYGVGA